MVSLLISSIAGMLMDKGLDVASKAIEGGLDKGVEYIEKKTGLTLNPDKGLSAQDVSKIKALEMDPKTKLELEQLALANKKEDNRHEEALVNADVVSTGNAQEMNSNVQDSANASWLAKNSAYILDFIIVFATVGLGYLLFFVSLPEKNMQIANITFGAMLGYVSAILHFHRGSSHGSKSKGEKLGAIK